MDAEELRAGVPRGDACTCTLKATINCESTKDCKQQPAPAAQQLLGLLQANERVK